LHSLNINNDNYNNSLTLSGLYLLSG